MKKIILSEQTDLIDIPRYIRERVEKELPEEHEELDKILEGIAKELLTLRFGLGWKELFEKEEVSEIISHRSIYYIVPKDIFDGYIKSKGYPNPDLINTFKSSKRYPIAIDQSTLHSKKLTTPPVFDLMTRIIDHRAVVGEELKFLGILDSEIHTYGEIKRSCPDLFEWMIDKFLEFNDRVEILTEEEDLNNLRKWIPEVMI